MPIPRAPAGPVAWEAAWQQALFGTGGFYRRPEGPQGHFRTATHAAALPLAAALIRLAGLAGRDAIVDVGAGRGELLTALHRLPGPTAGHGWPLRLHGVDVVARPAGLPAAVGWSAGLDTLPDSVLDGALVVAWELLDTVPCPVLEADDAGIARSVLVDPRTGVESLGAAAGSQDAAWCRTWWPLEGRAGRRAEVGRLRDRLWADLVARASSTPRGAVVLAVDYAHLLGSRPAPGTLAGYRAGRQVPPVPDGTCDVTAHVALDAVAAAGRAAGATGGALLDQRTALRTLGLTGSTRSPDGAVGLAGLVRASQEAELLDPGGLGGFLWLIQVVPGSG